MFSQWFLFKKKSKISFGVCFLTLHFFLGFFTIVNSLPFLIQVFFNVVKPTLMKFLYKQRCWIWRFHGIWKKKKASLIKIMPCPSEYQKKMDKAKNCFGFLQIIFWPFQEILGIDQKVKLYSSERNIIFGLVQNVLNLSKTFLTYKRTRH